MRWHQMTAPAGSNCNQAKPENSLRQGRLYTTKYVRHVTSARRARRVASDKKEQSQERSILLLRIGSAIVHTERAWKLPPGASDSCYSIFPVSWCYTRNCGRR